ncbi:SAM-dependent methyltransferase [Streptomyces sp. NPDC007088]|uniref:SAM-dependent methyltransferase n=1 Tax=Streptomyces sp. NPDC007088 TaxID=3364773 RepID=UPI003688C514
MNAEGADGSGFVDVDTPSVARMYDWLLGGVDNYPSDRAACEQLLTLAPSSKALAATNRAFLGRVVRRLARDYGVRQFIDHGSGLPTRENVHQIAQGVHPEARVVYVDNDPIVAGHGRVFLAENAETAVVQADMRDTGKIFSTPEVKRLIRADEPTAALFVSVLHCLPDSSEPGRLLREVARRLAPGSFLVVCQLVSEDARVREDVTELMSRATRGNWGRVRTRAELRDFLDPRWEVLPPGLVEVTRWHPGEQPMPWQDGAEWEEWGGVVRV